MSRTSRLDKLFTYTARLVLVAALFGCSKQSPELLITQAKESLSRKDYATASIQLKNALQKQDGGEVRFLLGKTLLELGDFPGAELQLRRALEANYSAESIYPELARALLGLGDFNKLTTELSAIKPTSPVVIGTTSTYLGEAWLALGKQKEAKAAFAAALKAAPGDPRALSGEARTIGSEGDLATASRIADEILAKSPDLPQALSLKADLLLSQGKTDEAMSRLASLVKVAPFDGQARFTLISLLIAGNKLTEANEAIEAMRKVLPQDIRHHYLRAVLAFRQGDPLKARDAVTQVLGRIPDHGPSLLLAGAAEYQIGSLATAADFLRKVLARYPNSLYARNLLIATYLRQGQPGKAEEVLGPALKQAPEDATVLRAAGEVAFANNRMPEAANYYNRALALEKDSAQLRTRLAQIRLANGETERALGDLEAASGLDNRQYQADLSLISTYLGSKQYDKALEAVAKLEKKQPDNPQTYSVKGTVYLARQDVKNARLSLEKALALQYNYLPAAKILASIDLADKNTGAAKQRFTSILAKEPENEGALLSLATAQAALREPAREVRATLDKAIKANPASVAARVSLINYLTQNRDPKAAIAVAEEAMVAMPAEPRILDALGLAQLAAGDATKAIETFKKMAALLPDSPMPLMRLASAQYTAKQMDTPIEALRKALVLKPDLLEAQREIIAVQLAAGRVDDALKETRAVQRARPKEAVGFAMEGDVLTTQQKLAEAAKAYGEGVKRQPMPELVIKQHQLLRASGQAAEAQAVIAKWLRENPDDPVVRFHIATTSVQSKDYRDAIGRFREILAKQPDNVPALNNLAWALHEMNDPSAAGYAEQAYAKAPANPDVQDTYGWLLVQRGDLKRGLELLTQATAASPASAEIRLHLAKAHLKSGDKVAAKRELEAIARQGANSPQKAEAEQLLRQP
ncbi:MAG: PEP-CTERM system TPR-repeat protein PrsT [Betaproteobacteria bacterium]|nr:PEP-CTERM system TPR-repeat protein PrsT [Betaproteobacteria bacterium]